MLFSVSLSLGYSDAVSDNTVHPTIVTFSLNEPHVKDIAEPDFLSLIRSLSFTVQYFLPSEEMQSIVNS